jgi:hypothetical protein
MLRNARTRLAGSVAPAIQEHTNDCCSWKPLLKLRRGGRRKRGRSISLARRHAREGNYGGTSERTGMLNWKIAPHGTFGLAHNLPPCASMIDLQMDSPIPIPVAFVV